MGLTSSRFTSSRAICSLLVLVMAQVLGFASLSFGVSRVSASTEIVYEPFGPNWVPGSQWSTATGANYTPNVVTDNAQVPTSALRLTSTQTQRSGGLIFNRAIPITSGLDISFTFAEWGGTGADGLSFFLQKGTETSTVMPPGGTLGYSADRNQTPNLDGLKGGLIGVGFDMFGNHGNAQFEGPGCPTSTRPGGNALVIRGPGEARVGYCILGTLKDLTANSPSNTRWNEGTSSRAGRARSARIVVDPSSASTPQVKVWICAAGSACSTSGAPSLAVNSPNELLGQQSVRFGFAAATGGFTNNHEIWDLTIRSQSAIAPVVITTTALSDGTVGTAYTNTVVASDGVPSYSYAVIGGVLPPGLILNAQTGAITGTPTTTGTYPLTIEVTDSRVSGQSGRTANRNYSISVVAAAPTNTVAPSNSATPPNAVAPSNSVVAIVPRGVVKNDSSRGEQGKNQVIRVLKNDVPAQAASWDARTVRLCAVGKASPNCALASRFVEGEGTYSVKDDGTVVFAPLSSFVGTATTIRYQVVDSKGATYSATLTPVVLAAELPATGSNLRLLTLVALVVMAAGALLHRERFRM